MISILMGIFITGFNFYNYFLFLYCPYTDCGLSTELEDLFNGTNV